jgi:acyl carrier protein
MTSETVLRSVMSAVFGVPSEEINSDSSMDTIKSWDSLKHMNLVIALEEEFEITIPDDEAANITSYALIRVVIDDILKT